MISPELNLKFQQQFKNLQIHAGLGLTEENIRKVNDICCGLSFISKLIYDKVYPEVVEPELPLTPLDKVEQELINTGIEEKPVVKSKK